MAFFDDYKIRNQIWKLGNYRDDLCNDGSAITNYNRKIDEIISDFQSFVKKDNSAVVGKLGDYKEPYQGNDSNLCNARTYIQREINRLNNKLSEDD